MSITKEQELERKEHLGASDVAALFTDDNGKSLDLFKNAIDVYTSKVYGLEPEKVSAAQDRGKRYEAPLIEFAEQELGVKIETNPDKLRFVCEAHPIFAANLDGYFIPATSEGNEIIPEIVEAKTTGLAGEWGIPGTDDCPLRVILQCQAQIMCTGWLKVHVVVLMGKFSLVEEIYEIERNEEIIKNIIIRGEQFWHDNVMKKIPPETTEVGNVQIFKRIVRVPDKYAEVNIHIIKAWDNAREIRLNAVKDEEEAFAVLLGKLGDAEAAKINSESELTYFSQKGADSIDRNLLKSEYPEIYAKIATSSTHRVARICKIK